ncbi:MAG: PoNe immunity protein domain-containing protein [Pseudomonadota bacterium]
MEPVTSQQKMRDPAGNAARYVHVMSNSLESETATKTATPTSLEQEVWLKSNHILTSKDIVLHKYGAGDAIESIAAEIISRSTSMAANTEFARANGDDRFSDFYAIDGTMRVSVAFTALALLLVEQPQYLQVFPRLLSPAVEQRSYLMDLMIRAFIPDHAIAKKYKADKWVSPWSDPVVRVLAGPESARAAGLAACMKNWCRVMRAFGWKPNLDTAIGKDLLFCDFAFEVALAVCAYDIDDSSFNDHPYYPRDLVEHYRANVRHTRDAWRPEGVGAGVPVVAPPPPKKADLAKSKRKAVARWVELACDGNVDATEAVLETVGKPRKFDEIDELMEALGEASQAINADIKDDETLAIQAGRLAEVRGLGEFEAPSGPPFGPARCTATLLAFAEWMGARGYRLVDLDNGDDAWHAVVVKAEYHDEFIALSGQLRIVTREPADIYHD